MVCACMPLAPREEARHAGYKPTTSGIFIFIFCWRVSMFFGDHEPSSIPEMNRTGSSSSNWGQGVALIKSEFLVPLVKCGAQQRDEQNISPWDAVIPSASSASSSSSSSVGETKRNDYSSREGVVSMNSSSFTGSIGGSLSLTSLSCNCFLKSNKTLDSNGGLRMDGIHPNFKSGPGRRIRIIVVMSGNRSKNRGQLQRGRVSTEAIQTVQSLKRAAAKRDSDFLERVFESNFRRLVKSDMIAVLRELQRQNQSLLALKVFEDVQKEHWYKPRMLIYVDMITVLANDGLFDKVQLVFSSLKMEQPKLEHDIDGFNLLLKTLMDFDFHRLSMECFHLMKTVVGCEPDRSTFRILINGFEAKGETGLSAILRMEAEKYFGEPLEFLEQQEEEKEEEMKFTLLERYRAISCRKESYH